MIDAVKSRQYRLWKDIPESERAEPREPLDDDPDRVQAWMIRQLDRPKCQAAVLCRQAGVPDKWRPCLMNTFDDEESFCVRHGGRRFPRRSPVQSLVRRMEKIKRRAKDEIQRNTMVVDSVEAALPAFDSHKEVE